MKKLVLACSLAATLSVPVLHAQGGAPASPAEPGTETPAAPKRKAFTPSYQWVEASYGFNYLGSGNIRVRSDTGYRLSGNVRLLQQVFFLGSYDRQTFTGDELTFWNAGFGGRYPVAGSTDLLGGLTYEKLESRPDDPLEEDFDADGLGYQVGMRTMLTPRTQFELGFKRAEYKGEDKTTGEDVKPKYNIISAGLIAPLTRQLDLTLRLEDWNGSGKDARDDEFENYLVGVRFRF